MRHCLLRIAMLAAALSAAPGALAQSAGSAVPASGGGSAEAALPGRGIPDWHCAAIVRAPVSACGQIFLDGYLAPQSVAAGAGAGRVEADLQGDATVRLLLQDRLADGSALGLEAKLGATSDGLPTPSWESDREWLYYKSDRLGELVAGRSPTGATFVTESRPVYGPSGRAINVMGPNGGVESLLLLDRNASSIDGVLGPMGADMYRMHRTTDIRYVSPILAAGLVLDIAYAPDGGNRFKNFFSAQSGGYRSIRTQRGSPNGSFRNLVDSTLTYRGEIAPGLGLETVLAYCHASAKDGAPGSAAAQDYDDVANGTRIGFGGWNLGEIVTWAGQSGYATSPHPGYAFVPSWGFSLEAGYEAERWRAGAWYQWAEGNGDFTTPGRIGLRYLGLGGSVDVVSHLDLFAELFLYSDKNTHGAAEIAAGTPADLATGHPHGQMLIIGSALNF